MIRRTALLFERLLKSNSFLVLVAVYPAFNAYALNTHFILPQQFVRLTLICALGGLAVYFIFFFALREAFQAALAATVAWMFFSFYGHFANVFHLDFKGWLPFWWFVAAAAATILAIRIGPRLVGTDAIPALNLMALVLILFPVIRMLRFIISQNNQVERTAPSSIQLELPQDPPDIYYIILDGYTRPDIMKERYGFNADGFVKSLEELGFYVAKCSRANYGFTRFSVGSSLNMHYLQDVSPVFRSEELDLMYAVKVFQDNLVRNSLESAGYKTIAYGTGFYSQEWRDADLFITYPELRGLTDSEIQFVSSSYARVLEDRGLIALIDLKAPQYRNRTLTTLNSVDETLAFPSPKFVFMHIISPHLPYVFDRSGNPVLPSSFESEKQGYGEQSEFISTAILKVAAQLISGSEKPPIIVIQGDHGRHNDPLREHAAILNAYYLPGHDDQLYPSISPVNTFRVIFNEYFGANFPLLEDVYYDNVNQNSYSFYPVPAEICPR